MIRGLKHTGPSIQKKGGISIRRKSNEEIEAIAKEIDQASEVIIAKYNFKDDQPLDEMSKFDQKALALDIKAKANDEIRNYVLDVKRRYDLGLRDLTRLYKAMKRLDENGR